MDHTFPAPRQSRGNQRVALVLGSGHVTGQKVAIRLQRWPRKVFRHTQLLVGVDEQQILAPLARQLQRLIAVVREIHPGPLVQFTGPVFHEFADHLLRAIGRAGVDDHPLVDPRFHAGKATLDHVCLVLDDHVQANGGLGWWVHVLTVRNEAVEPWGRVVKRILRFDTRIGLGIPLPSKYQPLSHRQIAHAGLPWMRTSAVQTTTRRYP